MPSGRTHDRITLWSLPIVAGLTFERTRSTSLTLMVSGGFLFSGLMFGPDLDTYSRQFKRWGVLRGIWLPYQQSMRHRAFLSHGPLVGTVVRLVYLLCWLAVGVALITLVSAIAYGLAGEMEQWNRFAQQYWIVVQDWTGRSLPRYLPQLLALVIGLELGALSHSCSDWIGSWYKQQFRPPKKSPPSRRRSPVVSKPAPPSPPPNSVPKIELPILPPPVQSDSQIRNRE